MPPPGFGFSEAARALRPTVSDIVWNLHCIIANPNSKLDEVRTARRRLLRLLKTSKFQEMIVPPLALSVSQQTERRLRQSGWIPRNCASSVVALSLETWRRRAPECRQVHAQAPQRTSALII